MFSNSKEVRMKIMYHGQSRTENYHSDWRGAGELWKSREHPKTCTSAQWDRGQQSISYMYGLSDPSTLLTGLTPESNIFTDVMWWCKVTITMATEPLKVKQISGDTNWPTWFYCTHAHTHTMHTYTNEEPTYTHIQTHTCIQLSVCSHTCVYTKAHT